MKSHGRLCQCDHFWCSNALSDTSVDSVQKHTNEVDYYEFISRKAFLLEICACSWILRAAMALFFHLCSKYGYWVKNENCNTLFQFSNVLNQKRRRHFYVFFEHGTIPPHSKIPIRNSILIGKSWNLTLGKLFTFFILLSRFSRVFRFIYECARILICRARGIKLMVYAIEEFVRHSAFRWRAPHTLRIRAWCLVQGWVHVVQPSTPRTPVNSRARAGPPHTLERGREHQTS